MNKNLPEVYSSFSSDFVSPLFPSRGEDVTLSVVFSRAVEKVILKYDSRTGLVFNADMTESGTFNGGAKYSATVPTNLDEENFRYFFAFFVDGVSWYYSKRGITRYTPSVPDRFSLICGLNAPGWVASSVCYQIFPDRFCNGDPSVGARKGEYEFDGGKVTTPEWTEEPKDWNESRCCDFYNGDLRGIAEKAEYLRSLGVSVIYINPVFSSRSVHRYDTVDFFHIDEKLGGDEALADMVGVMHENGIRVVLDISINHTGLDAVWLKKAKEDPSSPEHDFYYFNPDGSEACWQDVKTLPQLRYSSALLRDYMFRGDKSVMKKYLQEPFNIDGWRLDVAPEAGRRGNEQLCEDVWRDVNASLKSVKKELYLVGEDWDDSAVFLKGDMWDATMNYYGSGRPLRSWMGERDRFLGEREGHRPESEEPWRAEDVVEAFKAAVDSVPGQTPYFQMNLFDSHDTPRLHNNTAVFDRDIYKGVVMALYALPGMPNVYYGDEVLLRGKIDSNEGARYPMEWREERQDEDMKVWYSALGKVREDSSMAYSAVSFRALDEKAFAVIRFTSGKAYVSIINRGGKRKVSIPLVFLPKEKCSVVLGKGKGRIEDGRLEVVLDNKASLLISLE